MSEKLEIDKKSSAFIAHLIAICRDRGTRAELRRYWSQQSKHYAYPVLGQLKALGDENKSIGITAALYAVHERDGAPAHCAGGDSVGKAFLKLAGGGSSANAYDSTERHFRRLLACDALDELASQLHRLVKRLETKGIPLDYTRLLTDLDDWRRFGGDRVKSRWAMHFWQADENSTDRPEAA